MTLWAIARSPLILGGDLPQTDEATLKLITNERVLAVNQKSTNNREVLRRPDGLIVWTADVPGASDRYVAIFNTSDTHLAATVTGQDIGVSPNGVWMDLWSGFQAYRPYLQAHAAALYRVSKTN
jgi:alpha-galactosidase